MNKQLRQDLSSLRLERDTSSSTKLIGLVFKLWFIWAFVCLVGAVGIICVVWHFLAKFW